MLKYRQFISDFTRGKILPVYLFYGEEEFLVQEALDLIMLKIVEPGARDFNFNTLYCRETPASEIVNLSQTLPFLSERRLVIAKEIDAFKAGDLEDLVPYLRSPSPSTCLVMVSNQRKYDKKAVVSAVEEQGAVVVLYPLDDREVIPWAIGHAKRMWGLSLQSDAAHYLLEALGNDLQKIGNELQKVRIYIKDKKEITLEDVTAVAGNFREYTVFDLAEAIGQRNRERSLRILSRLLQEGEMPVGLLAMLDKHFSRLGQAKSMAAAGASYDEIKKGLKVFWRQAESFRRQMQNFTPAELNTAFDAMLSADRTLKSGGQSGRLVMDRLVLDLCGGN